MSRIHSFKQTQSHHYTGIIYERLNASGAGLSVFDVEIHVEKFKVSPQSNNKRKCVYYIHVILATHVNVNKITRYMHWKFPHCQKSSGGDRPMRSRGVFTCLNNSLEWIKSIVDVEFDYHLGAQICMLKVNSEHMKKYRGSEFAGYGIFQPSRVVAMNKKYNTALVKNISVICDTATAN